MVGTQVTHYRILNKLGGGGMGVVYEAEDLLLGRRVALKFLPPAVEHDAHAMERLRREARASSALNHPNICTVYEIGSEAGRHFIAMELLSGRTLATRIRGPVEVSRALDWGLQISEGLEAAHASGIIHRDIKPANIFVSNRGTVKLLDFGLSKVVATGQSGDSMSTATDMLTSPGAAVGTVAYMSPEQALGEEIDARTDVFSFGVVLYEMTTGLLPFQGKTSVAIFDALLHSVPMAPVSINPALPCELEQIINKCLEKDRELRYQSVAEVRADLKRLKRQTESGNLRFESRTGPPAAAPPRAHRRNFTIVGLALAALFVATTGWWMSRLSDGRRGSGPESTQRDAARVVAVLPFENISEDDSQDYFTTGITEEIRGQLSKLSSLQVVSRTAVERFRQAGRDLSEITRDLGVTNVVTGSVRQAGSQVRIHVEVVDPGTDRTVWSEQYDRELQDILGVQSEVALRIAEALAAKMSQEERERIEKRPTNDLEAYQLYLQSEDLKNVDAQQNLRAMAMLRQAIARDERFATAKAALAYRQMLQAYVDGPKYLEEGMATAQDAINTDPNLADGHFALASIYGSKGKATAARQAFLRALVLDPNHVGSMWNLSMLETDLGYYDEGLHWARRGFRLEPNSGNAYYHLAVPLLYLGDHRITEKVLREGEARFKESARVQTLLAMLDWRRGKVAESLARGQAASKLPGGGEAIMLGADLAVLTAAPDAEPLMRAEFEESPGLSANFWLLPESPRVRYAYVLATERQTRRAAELLKLAMREAEQALEAGDELPRTRLEVAAIHALRNDREAALRWLQQAYDAGWRDSYILAHDPVMSSLREDAAFRDLLSRMDKDVQAMRTRSPDLRDLAMESGAGTN